MTNPIQSSGYSLNLYRAPGASAAARKEEDQAQARAQQSQPEGQRERQAQPRVERIRRVEEQSQAETVIFQPNDPSQLPKRSQQALAAYRDTYQASQDLAGGGELVGLDLYV